MRLPDAAFAAIFPANRHFLQLRVVKVFDFSRGHLAGLSLSVAERVMRCCPNLQLLGDIQGVGDIDPQNSIWGNILRTTYWRTADFFAAVLVYLGTAICLLGILTKVLSIISWR